MAAFATGSIGVLAGCLGDDESTPEPVALDDGQSCDNCGMQIEMHPGPVGEAFYLDDSPSELPDDRDDGIAWFCSTWCLYTFVLNAAQRGTEPAVMYATDYSTVEYDLSEDDGTAVISAHFTAGSLTDVEDLTFVVDSAVQGAMGASLLGFSDMDAAESFASEHGGSLYDHDDVTLEVIETMGSR